MASNWKYLVKLISHGTNSACKKFEKDKKKKDLYKEWVQFKIVIDKIQENLDNIINRCSFQFFEVNF